MLSPTSQRFLLIQIAFSYLIGTSMRVKFSPVSRIQRSHGKTTETTNVMCSKKWRIMFTLCVYYMTLVVFHVKPSSSVILVIKTRIL